MKTVLQFVVVALVAGALAYGVLRYIGPAAEPAAAPAALPSAPALPPLSDAGARGATLAAELGCSACHSLDGAQGIGPSWQGAHGTLRLFADGTSVIADDAYLRESMLAPATRVVQGFQNVMVPATLSEAQIADLLALIHDISPTNFQ